MNKLEMTPELRKFFARVEQDEATGCWNWTGNVQTYTYLKLDGNTREVKNPRFSIGNKPIFARRYIFALVNTDFDSQSKLSVVADCENTLCVNPKHAKVSANKRNSKGDINLSEEHANNLLAQLSE